MKNLGIYVHVPFCLKKCNYCDFKSVANSNSEDHSTYFQGLQSEMLLWKELYGNRFYVDSIFIGGGTPSIVESSNIISLMASLRGNFNITDDAEITIECNPKTVTLEKLLAYKQAGINRLSIGAQSLDDKILSYMGRAHDSVDFYETFKLARQSGFENINIDLMFSVPGMTLEYWEETLNEVMNLNPEHISFYSLQLEENTPFFEAFKAGYFQEIPDELDREMYWRGVELLATKYVHYEISNVAKDGFECKHNLKYWSLKDYLGIGLGAHSYVDGCRFNNLALKTHVNTLKENMEEFIFTGMRKIAGIDLMEFQDRFGQPIYKIYKKEIEQLQSEKLVEIYNGRNGTPMMRFTPMGLDVSNKVLSLFV